jgi:hypothetical protein
MPMPRLVIVLAIVTTVLSVVAAGLFLYSAAWIYLNGVSPALEADALAAAELTVLNHRFSGAGILVPMLAYLLMGFVSLAFAGGQARKAIRVWRRDAGGHIK